MTQRILPHNKHYSTQIMNEKLMRRQLRDAKQEIGILREALKVAAEVLPYYEPTHPEYEGIASDAGRIVRDALSKTRQCRK